MSSAESRAATEAELQELHRLVAEALLSHFQEAARCEACGRSNAEAAILRVAAAFLRDNSVAVDAAAAADMRRSLSQLTGLSLPFKPTR